MKTFFLTIAALSLRMLAADPYETQLGVHYKVTKIPTPPGVDPQVGAVAVLADGRIATAFHHGEIGIFNPRDQSWKIFAEGLHEPLGLLEEKDGSLLVMQRPELTRLRDTDGDGVADQFDSLWAGFGMTGNYHEFAFGPARGPTGKLYVSLNLASSGASIRPEIRGDWNPAGLPRAEFYNDWKTAGPKAGRMYSRVPWRGWVMEIDPQSGLATPFASGFRSPDGIGFDAAGNLLVSDNQGDWRGTSELHVVRRDGFYGHPASLVWRKDWDGSDPLQTASQRLDSLRTPAAVWFPHNIYANSPTQPVIIPKSAAWGPYGGQTLIGEMSSPRLLRLLMEEIDGVWQGACINLAEIKTLKGGMHRLAFSGDTLWIGRTHLSWAGGEGLATFEPQGKTPFEPLDIHVTPRGFRIEFTEPLAAGASDPASWAIEHYTYAYHVTYGSPQMGKAVDVPTRVTLSKDGKSAEIELAALHPDFIYDIRMEKVVSLTGAAPLNPHLAYTVRRVPK
ncbi:MAG: Glucose/sorbosone dehydrogenase-like protein [Chthoniobacteraceae bacterium]|nr:Glucose/sorbosone dehydrogenase-like protein [Chthoniobacteraceae bacterium]